MPENRKFYNFFFASKLELLAQPIFCAILYVDLAYCILPIAYIVVLPMQYTPLSKGSPRITQHSIIHSACVLDAMLLLYFITPYKPSKTNFHFWKTMVVYRVDRGKKQGGLFWSERRPAWRQDQGPGQTDWPTVVYLCFLLCHTQSWACFFFFNAVWFITKNFEAFDLIAQSSSSAPPSFPSHQFANLKSCGWRH